MSATRIKLDTILEVLAFRYDGGSQGMERVDEVDRIQRIGQDELSKGVLCVGFLTNDMITSNLLGGDKTLLRLSGNSDCIDARGDAFVETLTRKDYSNFSVAHPSLFISSSMDIHRNEISIKKELSTHYLFEHREVLFEDHSYIASEGIVNEDITVLDGELTFLFVVDVDRKEEMIGLITSDNLNLIGG